MELMKSVRLLSNVMFFRMKHGNPSEVDRHWNNYWKTIEKTGRGGQVLWDNEPERASAVDIERFRPHFDLRLPVLDFGCGNGRQTRFLAKQFDRVIGTDVSPRAIDLARGETAAAGMNIDYRVLDALRPEQARAFHAEFGDVNIYMRTVLHVIQRKDRQVFAESLAVLLGERGTLYQIELALCALDYFRTLPGNSPSGLPSHVHNVIKTGATSVGFEPKERPLVYPDEHWQVIAEGPDTIKTVPLYHGDEGHVPASYLILRTRKAS